MDYLALRDLVSNGYTVELRRAVYVTTLEPVDKTRSQLVDIAAGALDLSGLVKVKETRFSVIDADKGIAQELTRYYTAKVDSPRVVALRLFDLFGAVSPAVQDCILNTVYSQNHTVWRDSTISLLNRIDAVPLGEDKEGGVIKAYLQSIGAKTTSGVLYLNRVEDLGDLYAKLSDFIYKADALGAPEDFGDYDIIHKTLQRAETLTAVSDMINDKEESYYE